jgi:hypothetical protein
MANLQTQEALIMRQPNSPDRKSTRPDPEKEPFPLVPNNREFQLSLARTAYNYVRSYPNLDAVRSVPACPADEAFSPPNNALVLETRPRSRRTT